MMEVRFIAVPMGLITITITNMVLLLRVFCNDVAVADNKVLLLRWFQSTNYGAVMILINASEHLT